MKRRALSGYLQLALCLCFALLTTHCDSNPPPEPALAVSTQRLDFDDDKTRLDLTITNEGRGTLAWSINDDQNWILATPSSGETTGGGSQVTVTVDRAGLDPGGYTGTLRVEAGEGGRSTVSVFMTVEEMPTLAVDPTELDFGMEETVLPFNIKNTGTGTLSWTVTADQSWIAVSPTSGETTTETDEVTVTVDRSGLASGRHEANVEVTSNDGSATVPVMLEVLGDLGVFSEMADEILEPGDNAFIGAFEGPNSTIVIEEDDTIRRFGAVSMKATISVDETAGGFAGWFVSWGDASTDDTFVRDMSAYQQSGLQFWVKSPINLEVGVRSGNVPAGSETSRVLLSDVSAFAPDDVWRQVCIPIANFEGPSPKADLSRIKVFFVITSNVASGGTGGAEVMFWVDDVLWISTPCN